jgi:phosphoribosyl-AMP cyclohydrolase
MSWIDELTYDSNGLIPAVIQDWKDKEVLMVAWMNKDSLRDTVEKGKTHFWSRSRKKYWMKGEESGNVQNVKHLAYDCDKDCLVIQVEQVGGAACHTGHRSCFYTVLENGAPVEKGEKLFDPEKVYGKKA